MEVEQQAGWSLGLGRAEVQVEPRVEVSISSHLTFCAICGLLPELWRLVLPTWICPSLGPSHTSSCLQFSIPCVFKLQIIVFWKVVDTHMCPSTLHTLLSSNRLAVSHTKATAIDNVHHNTKNSTVVTVSILHQLNVTKMFVPKTVSSPIPMK